ncbi:hypothetical protein lse_0746 [Listeria seeligeri serovar 1/2b str. SLCC3954]|nr:hypothetical protein lse_0746 [Listeria seeligeri serovar 1/2b str. SLCC3954]
MPKTYGEIKLVRELAGSFSASFFISLQIEQVALE